MVADTEEATEFVVTVKVTLLLPAAILTEPGTAAEVLLLERETVAPPAGAAPLRVTVPVTDVPPVTLAGLTATEESVTPAEGVIVSSAVLLLPP